MIKNYFMPLCENILDRIRTNIGDHYIWLAVEETTHSFGRDIVNVVIWKLCKELEKTNDSTIACIVSKDIHDLLPAENSNEKFIFLLSDNATYIMKEGQVLTSFYQNM